MATTYSPTRSCSLEPSATAGKSVAPLSSRTARSSRLSRPITLAENSRSSASLTLQNLVTSAPTARSEGLEPEGEVPLGLRCAQLVNGRDVDDRRLDFG